MRLNALETKTLIRQLHQENVLTTAFPKFLESNYLEVTENDESSGLLILDLAG